MGHCLPLAPKACDGLHAGLTLHAGLHALREIGSCALAHVVGRCQDVWQEMLIVDANLSFFNFPRRDEWPQFRESCETRSPKRRQEEWPPMQHAGCVKRERERELRAPAAATPCQVCTDAAVWSRKLVDVVIWIRRRRRRRSRRSRR